MADYCTVSGTLRQPDYSYAPAGTPLTITKAVKSGTVITLTPMTVYVAGASGAVSFTVPKSSTAYIFSRAYTGATLLDKQGGVPLSIPDADTATLESLGAAVTGPTTGLTLKEEGSALAGLYSTVNFVGSNVTVTQASAGVATVTVSSAPPDATFITQTPSGSLSAEQSLSLLATGLLKNTTATGVLSIATGSDLPSGIPLDRLSITGTPDGTKFLRDDGSWQTVNTTPAWADITGKPTTLSGFGITDAQPLDAELSALAGLTSAADRLPYFTGSGTASLATFTGYGRSLTAVADEAAFKALVNLEIGVDVQAFSSNLSTFAAIAPSANVVTLLGAADYSAFRTSLGVAIGSNVQAWDADIDAVAALSPTNDDIIQRKAGAWTNRTMAQLATDLNLSGTYQSLDATLTSLAAFNTNGLLTQTAADTFTGRTITGTSSRLSVSNGNGVSGNPTLDIDAAYVGQTSITTLGTIGTGTWNATAIADGKIASALTGKTYNGLTITSSTGTLTIANSKTLISNNNLTLTATDGATLAIGGGGTLGTAAYTAASAYEVPLTFGSGVSRSVNAISLDQTFAPTWTGQHLFSLGTITTSKPIAISETWNAGAVVFDAFTIAVINTAANTSSNLAKFSIGGVTRLTYDRAGQLAVYDTSGANLLQTTGTKVQGYTGANSKFVVDRTAGMFVTSDLPIGFWSGTNTDSGAADSALSRLSAGVIGIGTGSVGSFTGSLKLTTLTAVGTISTADPTSGQGPVWKLGARKAAVVALDATQYLEVDVAGTIYKVAIVT